MASSIISSIRIAPSSVWSFPADAEIVEVVTAHVIDPVTFYVVAKDRPAWFIEMEQGLRNNVKRFPFDIKLHSGDTVAYWHEKDRKYVRARVEEPYKEMSSKRIKGYIFLIDRGVYVTSYIGDRDIVDLEASCRLIPDGLLALNKLPLAHKMRIPSLTPVKQEIEFTSKGRSTSLKPSRNAEYTEAAVKFTRRLFNIAESAAMTKSYELYLLLPEEIDNQRYRSGLCGRETLVEPGATVNYRDLLIKADFARSIVDAPSDDYPIEGCNRYPRPKFTAAMFTKRQREEPKNGVDVSRDVICKKPQKFNWEEADKEVDEKVRYWLAKKKLKAKNDEDDILESAQPQQPSSLLTMENFNSREEPNPKLEWKMKNWFSHK